MASGLEGFFLEVSLALIADSLAQFKNHFAGRQLRRYLNLFQLIIDALSRAAQLIKYQQYKISWQSHQQEIQALILVLFYPKHLLKIVTATNH